MMLGAQTIMAGMFLGAMKVGLRRALTPFSAC